MTQYSSPGIGANKRYYNHSDYVICTCLLTICLYMGELLLSVLTFRTERYKCIDLGYYQIETCINFELYFMNTVNCALIQQACIVQS